MQRRNREALRKQREEGCREDTEEHLGSRGKKDAAKREESGEAWGIREGRIWRINWRSVVKQRQ